MTISKEGIEAAARAVLNRTPRGRLTPQEAQEAATAAITAALPFLALRPAPSQSDDAAGEDAYARTEARMSKAIHDPFLPMRVFAATVRTEATLAGAAAAENASMACDMWQQDSAAKDRKIAALTEALTLANQFLHPGNVEIGVQMKIDAALSASPPTDPAENGDEVVFPAPKRTVVGRIVPITAPDPAEAMRAKCEAKCRDIAMLSRNLSAGAGATKCADAIAALKGNGEGL